MEQGLHSILEWRNQRQRSVGDARDKRVDFIQKASQREKGRPQEYRWLRQDKGKICESGDEANRSHAFGARFEAAQAEIDKLDGAEFQRLCTRYVRDKYGLDGLTALGMKAGTYGTTQGTPDAFWEYPDGSFLAMEAGHCNSSRSAAKKKILNDIKKCLDYEEEYLETGYIKRIVVCYSFSRFAMGDFKEIYDTFPKRDIDLVGPDELAIAVIEISLGSEGRCLTFHISLML